ncbi:MAG: hypothetical protein LBL52_01820 [Rickettsiales bacterium]|nr:hypothetical protein [Rickettsiales bacterium]
MRDAPAGSTSCKPTGATCPKNRFLTLAEVESCLGDIALAEWGEAIFTASMNNPSQTPTTVQPGIYRADTFYNNTSLDASAIFVADKPLGLSFQHSSDNFSVRIDADNATYANPTSSLGNCSVCSQNRTVETPNVVNYPSGANKGYLYRL